MTLKRGVALSLLKERRYLPFLRIPSSIKGVGGSMSRKIFTVIFLIGLFAVAARAEQTIQCAPGEYDMLDWMTMDDDLRGTYHLESTGYKYLDPSQPSSGYAGPQNGLYTELRSSSIVYNKTSSGRPWDVFTFDQDGIYPYMT